MFNKEKIQYLESKIRALEEAVALLQMYNVTYIPYEDKSKNIGFVRPVKMNMMLEENEYRLRDVINIIIDKMGFRLVLTDKIESRIKVIKK